ncbi:MULTISPECIES: hypothetical protein [Bacillus]|nr:MULTISPECIES: hypothetical protein [Bacillus]MDU0070259.1 hypothetical protein [Bacillus sp. IG6]MED8017805.1 hypothetical protein [Bacillus glycinifermentans]WKB77252.1 hypothetical protein QYM22_23455 [Bacillus glycinifermentans]SCA88420.1 hypothetical protein BGLY_4597 [Bacillus glycinifermentans]
MGKRVKRFSFMLAVLLMISSVPAMAEGAEPPKKEKEIADYQQKLEVKRENIAIDRANIKDSYRLNEDGQSLNVTKPKASVKSNYSSSEQSFQHQASLTETNKDDLWFFSTPSDRTFIARILSNNADYTVQLYVVDWEKGQAIPTNISASAGNLIALNELPKGDYALRVFSAGDVGDSYTIQMNARNPAHFTSAVSVSSSLQQFVAEYEDGSVYANGTFVYNKNGGNSHLDWKRVFYFPYGGGYTQRTHEIADAKVKSVSAPVSYKASYASSEEAIMVYLDKGTLFMHHQSAFQSGVGYEGSFVDTLGKVTPRRIDDNDFEYGDHILIVDLKTGKSIDFFSVLNYYYASGVEKIPAIQYLN